MISALIFAGGSGTRMNSKTKPKQFLEVNGKAIILHTIEYFEKNPNIDNIVVVSVGDWIDYLREILDKNNIKKVKWIVPGGETGQESIKNGLTTLYENSDDPENSIVLIHDGVRPLISQELIDANIESVKQHRSAITVAVQNETTIIEEDNVLTSITEKANTRLARAPESFYLGDIYGVHQQNEEKGIEAVDSASLMHAFGYPLHLVEGPNENLKITTPVDFYIMRAIFEARENSQIFGL